MYVSPNFKTKKALKEAVAKWNRFQEIAADYGKDGFALTVGAVLLSKEFGGRPQRPVTVFQPGPFGGNEPTEGKVTGLEGPHYPEPHKWYASGLLKDGYLIKVS